MHFILGDYAFHFHSCGVREFVHARYFLCRAKGTVEGAGGFGVYVCGGRRVPSLAGNPTSQLWEGLLFLAAGFFFGEGRAFTFSWEGLTGGGCPGGGNV